MWKSNSGALKAMAPETKSKSRGNGYRGGTHFNDNLGVKAAMMEERSIAECLSCQKPECNGCVKSNFGRRATA